MASFFGLEQLARFAPQIFGRALSIDGVLGSLSAHSGRHDHLDRHTYEMRAAFVALRQLCQLADSDKTSAQVIAYSHVVCGEEARAHAQTWLSLALQLLPPKKSPKTQEQEQRLIAQGLALYGTARDKWILL